MDFPAWPAGLFSAQQQVNHFFRQPVGGGKIHLGEVNFFLLVVQQPGLAENASGFFQIFQDGGQLFRSQYGQHIGFLRVIDVKTESACGAFRQNDALHGIIQAVVNNFYRCVFLFRTPAHSGEQRLLCAVGVSAQAHRPLQPGKVGVKVGDLLGTAGMEEIVDG